MRCKAGKTQGPVLLPPFVAQSLASGKITNALATAQPCLFYRLSPKAVRLTVLGSEQDSAKCEDSKKEAQRPVRARGRESGPRAVAAIGLT